MKQKLTYFILILAVTVMSLGSSVAKADSSVDSSFNPNELISDNQFSDTKSMGGASDIQKFLESKNSPLANTSADFLPMLKEPQSSSLKEALEDPHPNSDKLRTAAELVWDSAQSSGLNPQVILVTLNKEQGLITGDFSGDRLQRSLDYAMGFGCPDSGGCGDTYKGFYHQLFGGLDDTATRYLGATKSLMRSFSTPGGRGPFYNGGPAKVGDTIVLGNTLGGYPGVEAQQTVTIKNNATAALYRYTPHVFNGNYNFFRYFKEWFGYSNGSLLKTKGSKNLYAVENGVLYTIPPLVAQLRGLDASSARTVSTKVIKSYKTVKTYGATDNTIVSVSGKYYVFVNNQMHPASTFVLGQRGLNSATAITISETDAKDFEKGSVLTPSDGSVIRGKKNPAVYLVENGTLKLFTAETFAQRDAGRILQLVPDEEIDSYPKDGMVSPLAGAIIKSLTSPTVYLLEKGVKYGLTAELFSNRGLSFKDIKTISQEEIAKIPSGGLAIPKDNTAIKSNSSQTVYYILDGQVRPMTYKAFVARKVDPKSIIVFSKTELETYPKGPVLNN